MKLPIALTLFIISFLPFDLRDDAKSEGYFVGGVVPHHNLVVDEIERFWYQVSERYDPEYIILVGPDHNDIGTAPITTSLTIGDDVNQEKSLVEVDVVADEDHSIQIHLPYIHKLFSNAHVIALAIRSDASQLEVVTLSNQLRELLHNHNVFVAASVDFSHYLPRNKAGVNDQFSLQSIRNFSYNDLEYMNADYIDSDQSVVLVSELVCPSHDCIWEEYYHGNSEDYIPSYDVTTSYFTLFIKGK